MTISVQILPALTDNYIFVLHTPTQRVVIDPGAAAPVFMALGAAPLDAILLTHHHADHINGVAELQAHYGCPVYGGAEDVAAGRLPAVTQPLPAGARLAVGVPVEVLATPGHTPGHISYYVASAGIVFSGDTVFGGGCGRLLAGGTPAQMFQTLQTLRALPPATRIYCAHEYTATNLQFALTQDIPPAQLAHIRARLAHMRVPSVPLMLADELKTNILLQAATQLEFTCLRQARDNFVG